ncbi:MAG: signal recognition particle-docking protein FtsY [Phyllobacterium sp.]
MALGFIKKIFSFGKKQVEDVPVENAQDSAVEAPIAETPALETPVAVETVETVSAPAVEPAVAVEEAVTAAEEPQSDGIPVPLAEAEPETPPVIEAAEEPAPPEPVTEEPEIIEEREEPRPETFIDVEAVRAEEAAVAPADEEPPLAEPVTEIAPEEPAPVEPPAEEGPVVDAPAIEPKAAEPEPQAETETPPPAPEPTPAKKVTVAKSVEEKREEAPLAAPEPKLSWFQRLRKGLSRSSQQLGDSIGGIFTRRKLDEDTLQDLEDVLIQADLGLETAMRITDALSQGRYGKDISTAEVQSIMASEIEKVLAPVARPLELDLSHKPHVILVVGVNGTGKTTTIGKLAAKLTAGGLKVMLAAGDTFRAAAIEQLHIWGERTGSPVVSSKLGADAAGLAYDAWQKAKDAGSDVLIIDTAGRLQNKAELMEELAKVVRVLGKHDPEAPHTVLQTLDATTGQNALNQVEIFRNIAGVNGLVMTKLDGTARGGILVAISARHKLPIYFIGVGEQVDDLEPFAASDFAKAIAGVAE